MQLKITSLYFPASKGDFFSEFHTQICPNSIQRFKFTYLVRTNCLQGLYRVFNAQSVGFNPLLILVEVEDMVVSHVEIHDPRTPHDLCPGDIACKIIPLAPE